MKKIPKILHLFWGRGEKQNLLHPLQALTAYSFLKLNPEYKIKLWIADKNILDNDKELQKLIDTKGVITSKNALDLFDLSKGDNIVQKSDLFRYKILEHEGGFWSDFDILYFRPIVQMRVAHKCPLEDIDSGLCWGTPQYPLPIGFMFSAPKSKCFADLNEYLDSFPIGKDYQHYGIYRLWEMFLPYGDKIKIYKNTANIEIYCVYPLVWPDIGSYFYGGDFDILSEYSIGAHWHYNAKIAKEFLATLENKENSLLYHMANMNGLGF